MGRNNALLQEIIDVLDSKLDDPRYALDHLEGHFHHRLLVDVGNTTTVATMASQLRLSIIEEECSRVLDYMAETNVVRITVDHVEQVVWELFDNRFIEP